MTTQTAKTIDINALEWFDRVNGNSYFAGTVTVDFGLSTQKEFCMPYEYGYGDYYLQAAKALLIREGFLSDSSLRPLTMICRDDLNIVLRYNKQENCLKRDLKALCN